MYINVVVISKYFSHLATLKYHEVVVVIMSSKIKLLACDFDGVFTDNKVILSENGIEHVTCNRSDGLGVEMLRKQGNTEVIVISKEVNPVVAQRCKKLKVECYQNIQNNKELYLQKFLHH